MVLELSLTILGQALDFVVDLGHRYLLQNLYSVLELGQMVLRQALNLMVGFEQTDQW